MKLNDFFLPEYTESGIPLVEPAIHVPKKLRAYKTSSKKNKDKDCTLHFFIDDYRFENLWNFPFRYLNDLSKFEAVIAPDFSLYAEYPEPLNIWNPYRNRWLTIFWQYHNLTVIPCLSWSDERSFNYCFDGVPKGSVIAIASMKVKKSNSSADLFIAGVKEAIHRLKPSTVLVYGEKFKSELKAIAPIFKFYPHYRSGNGR